VTSEYIKKVDPEIAKVVDMERDRQENTLEMIASENITSRSVMAVQGSILTNKYAEGYPAKRFYGGCEYVDIAEKLAIDRAKKLFDCAFANVQPHSGSQANMAVYFALLNPGDTVLGMDLAHGGHLTHGSPASFSGKLFNFVHYGVTEDTNLIDYENLAVLAEQHKPKMIVAGASAYPRTLEFEKLSAIARSVDAYLMVDMAHIAGLVAAGVHPSPMPYADVVTSTTHKTLRGPRGGMILSNKDLGDKFNRSIFPGIQGGPLMHVIAAKALAFKEALSEGFKGYQEAVVANASVLANRLMKAGLNLVSGGTDNHMMLVDLRERDITGKDAETLLDKAGITVNKNAVPFETRSPFITSGIRVGTPAITTRGMRASEMETIAQLMSDVLNCNGDKGVINRVRNDVQAICKTFPIYND